MGEFVERAKFFIILSSLITFNSLASISDAVFKWKGFISDGLEFYRANITSPLTKFFSLLNLEYELFEMNVIIITFLITLNYATNLKIRILI